MEKSIKIILSAILMLLGGVHAEAQVDEGRNTEFYIGGQLSRPFTLSHTYDFSEKSNKGIYAKPGGGFTLELNSRKQFGFGGLISYAGFGVDWEGMNHQLGSESIDRTGIINSTQLGFGPVGNFEILPGQIFFQVKSYVGIRFLSAPDFTANYDPRDSRFVTVDYQVKSQTSLYYQVDMNFQFFPMKNFGFSLGVNYLGGGINSLKYDYITTGSKVIEGQDKIHQAYHFLNYKLGIVLPF
mgnify:CR=1 FL=1